MNSLSSCHGVYPRDCTSGSFPASRVSQCRISGLASGYSIILRCNLWQKTIPRPRAETTTSMTRGGPQSREKHGHITWTGTGSGSDFGQCPAWRWRKPRVHLLYYASSTLGWGTPWRLQCSVGDTSAKRQSSPSTQRSGPWRAENQSGPTI